MSLINSVLIELDQRRALSGAVPGGVFHGLDPVNHRYVERERNAAAERVTLIAIGLLTCVALALALSAWRGGNGAPDATGVAALAPAAAPRAVSVATAVPTPAPVSTTQPGPGWAPGLFNSLSLRMDQFLGGSAAAAVIAAPAAAAAGLPAPDAPPLVSTLAAHATQRGFELELMLSATAAYSIYPLSDPERLVIELDGARLAEDLLPQGLSGEGITGYRPRHEDGRAVIVLDLAEAVTIADSTLEPRAQGYVLSIGLDRRGIAAPQTPQTPQTRAAAPEKTAVTPSGDGDGGNADFQHALRMYREGNVAEGLARMVEIMDRNPGDAAGRTLLAEVLIEQRDTARALQVLDQGLARDAAHWQWALRKAQVLNSRQQDVLAVDVLERHLAAAGGAPEYLALLAGLQQKNGSHAAAAGHYQRLVELDAGNGLWWLGLGISRQALAQADAARQAFDMALRDPALRPDLRKFAQARLRLLDHS
jgi:MSHA biogenesis protein MshN